MRGWIPARISGHQPSTCYDLMWSWCNKRHAPSPFSHEPLSSSHASTAVLPLPIYVRIHGTRIKNEKRGKRSGQTSQNADRRKRNGMRVLVVLPRSSSPFVTTCWSRMRSWQAQCFDSRVPEQTLPRCDPVGTI